MGFLGKIEFISCICKNTRMSQKNKKKIANKNKIKKNTEKATTRLLMFADDGQLYGKCTKVDGDRRFQILCSDGKTRTGKLRGKIRKRKKSWLSIGIWVIVALRDFQDDKCDIIHMFDEDEVNRLEGLGELSIYGKIMDENCPFSIAEEEIDIDDI